MVTIKIDKDQCIGCGLCAGIYPEIFEIKDGKSVVKSSPDKFTDTGICPVHAISIEKDRKNKKDG